MSGRAARRILAIIVAVSVALAMAPGPSCAGEPTEQVRGAIDRVLEILKKKDLQTRGGEDGRSHQGGPDPP